MACRIQNLTERDLALDLRDGTVYVGARALSPALREEHLYDNVHLPELIRTGAVRVVKEKMAEVLRAEGAVQEDQPETEVDLPAGGSGQPEIEELDEAVATGPEAEESKLDDKKPAGKTVARKKA